MPVGLGYSVVALTVVSTEGRPVLSGDLFEKTRVALFVIRVWGAGSGAAQPPKKAAALAERRSCFAPGLMRVFPAGPLMYR